MIARVANQMRFSPTAKAPSTRCSVNKSYSSLRRTLKHRLTGTLPTRQEFMSTSRPTVQERTLASPCPVKSTAPT